MDSDVQRNGEQAGQLLTFPGTVALQLHARELLASVRRHGAELGPVEDALHEYFVNNDTSVVYTSRVRERLPARREREIARSVSSTLVRLAQEFRVRHDFVIRKGGTTSSDADTHGHSARRAVVLGQTRPGVPVRQLGEESHFPGLAYVAFPENVGSPVTLLDIASNLSKVTTAC